MQETCVRCGKKDSISEYFKETFIDCGYPFYCAKCNKELNVQWFEKNKDELTKVSSEHKDLKE
jgi:hypothetical protein